MRRLDFLSNQTWTSTAPLLLGALTVMFGLQMLRMLIVGMAVYLGQVKDLNPALLGVIGLAVFLCAFLAPSVQRVLGSRHAFQAVAGGLGLVRLVEQLVSSVPVDLGLSIVGTVLFLWALPLLFQQAKASAEGGAGYGAIALLLGISADTAVKGIFDTVDLSWVEGAAPDMVVVALAVALGLLVWLRLRVRNEEPQPPPAASSLPYLVVGPALALEFLLFQNIAQQTVLIGWDQPAVYAWLLIANLAGIVVAVEVGRLTRPVPWPVQALLAGLLFAMVAGEQSGVVAALIVLAGHVVIATALVSATLGQSDMESVPRAGDVSGWLGTGMIALLVLIFLYYASYDTDVIIPREAVRPLAALLVGFAAVRAGLFTKPATDPVGPPRAAAIPALLLLLLPLLHLLSWEEVGLTAGDGFPVRVMSYNLHQGFDVQGSLGMEALSEVIEEQDPDILALQEVSRGWVMNDSVDMLVWLSQRLEMPYVWGPATDPVWGNAVLSRFPITRSQNNSMPNNGLIRLDRGYLTLEVDVGGGEMLDVVGTHFHAGADDSTLRIPQALAILESVDKGRSTVLLGDMNAHPDHPEMLLIAGDGFNDTFIASGETGDGFTARSNNPWERIDYIWASDNLKARDFTISESPASDHFAVSVTIYR